MKERFNVAVVGATGLVGETMVEILGQRDFPVDTLHVIASERSLGKRVEWSGHWLPVQDLSQFDFAGVDLALFSPGAGVSAIHAPRAAAAGCIVIDNTSQFRYDDDIPLIVPEVNPEALAGYSRRNIIANPNCSTIQMVVALKPIHDAVGIARVNVATYQAVSGAGRGLVETLARETSEMLSGRAAKPDGDTQPIAFNAVPHIDSFQDNGYTLEEMKMVWETRKILGDDSILVNATAVRIPVFFGHSAAVHIETRDKISAPEVRKLMEAAPGIVLQDECRVGGYPTAVTEAATRDPVFVGRIREDISHDCGINLWVTADNVRKGAALNSIQIAEILVRDYL